MEIKGIFKLTAILLLLANFSAGQERARIKQNIPLDSIRLSAPFILADRPSNTYYMTGTGGMLWKSKGLKL